MSDILIPGNAYLGFHRAEPKRRRSRARSHIQQKMALLLGCKLFQNLPKIYHCQTLLMIIYIHTILFQLIHIKIRLTSWNNQVKLLVVEQCQPLWFEDFEETFTETSCLFLQLLVALVVAVWHDELEFILSELVKEITLWPVRIRLLFPWLTSMGKASLRISSYR